MRKFKFLLLLVCAFFSMQSMAVDLNKACDETFLYLLNQKLNKQSVIISAPGYPSHTHDMSMVAEDPNHDKNKDKQYHPAEKQGWEKMISQGRLLEKAKIMKLQSGQFEEISYLGEKFKFYGYLMQFTKASKPYLRVMESLGRVGLMVGNMQAVKIESFSKTEIVDGKPQVTVKFSTALANKAPWVNDEIAKAFGINAITEGTETVKMGFYDNKWSIDDKDFLFSVKIPVFDFQ